MLRKLREMQDDEGFTLIELLVVVIIIGILAAIAIPVFLNQREKAYQKAVQSDLRNAAIQIESYFADYNQYPPSAGPFDGDTQATYALGNDQITVSSAVTMTYSLGTDSRGYCLVGDHDAITTESFYYDSAAGGLVDEADIAADGVYC